MSSNNNDNNLNERSNLQSPNPNSDNRIRTATSGLRRFIVRRESFNQNAYNQYDLSIRRNNNYLPSQWNESIDFGTGILRDSESYMRRDTFDRVSRSRRLQRTNSNNPFMNNNISPIRNNNAPAAGNDDQLISDILNSNSNITDNTNLNVMRAEPLFSFSLSEVSDEQEDSVDSIIYSNDFQMPTNEEDRMLSDPIVRNRRRISLRSFLGRRREQRRRQETMQNNHFQLSSNPIRIEYDLDLNEQADVTISNSKNCTYIHNKHYFHFKEYPLKLNIVDLENEDTPAGKINNKII